MTYEIDGKEYVSLAGGQDAMDRDGDSSDSQKPLPKLAPPKLITCSIRPIRSA
jgi:hypothetical protein